MSNEENTDQTNATTPQQEAASYPRWSWGAFMFDPVFLIAIRKYVWLLLYLLMFIPVINVIAAIGIKIFLGIKGPEMAAHSASFETAEQQAGFMNAFDHAGFVIFAITVVVLLVGLLISAAFAGSFFGTLMHGVPGPTPF